MDRLGSRRVPFLLCLASLAGPAALLVVGTNISLWVSGRFLQGVSAGMLWVFCLALLTDTVGQAHIGRAVGVIGIPMSIGPIVRPLIGGVIYGRAGYYSVFGLMFALLGVDAPLRLIMIESSTAQRWLETEINACPESGLPSNLSLCPSPSETSHNMPENSD